MQQLQCLTPPVHVFRFGSGLVRRGSLSRACLFAERMKNKLNEWLCELLHGQSDKENLMKEAKDERKRVAERKIQSAIGFRQVIDLLSSEKRLEFMQWL
ncbi:hypothetical protein Bca4012_037670 [Brassica carinata]